MKPRAITLLPVLTLATLTAACGATVDDGAPKENVARVGQRIVNGVPSTSADDFVVRINIGGGGLCTGTLIAPNLVLTARHCVSNMNENSECGTFTSTMSPTSFSIALGQNAGTTSVARGSKLFIETGPGKTSGCSNDIALIQLDRNISGAKIAKVRLYKLETGEAARTVGYGDSGNGNLTPGRYQKSGIKVDAVGPTNYTFTTKQNRSIPVSLPSGEIITGESTCFGDSGGPLFDASNNVIGVTSRGIDGNCIDRPSIYSDTASHAELIKGAATAAGHPLVEATPPSKPADPKDSTPTTDTPREDDEETGKPSGTTKKPSKPAEDEEEDESDSTDSQPQVAMSSGCSASGTHDGGAPIAFVFLGMGLTLVIARRRKNA